MTVYLRYKPEKIVDRDKFINTYTSSAGYKMLKGAPLLVNVEGSLIDSSIIMDLIANRNQRVLSAVNRWLAELKEPPNAGGIVITFKWRR